MINGMERSSLILFVIGQVISLAISYFYPYILAAKDAIQIEMNGSFDTLKKRWHRLNVIIRILNFAPLQLLAVLPLALIEGMYWRAALVYGAMMFLSNAWHWLAFDKTLNQLRGLGALYIGNNAESDLFLKKHPNAKRTALIAGVSLYICSVISLFI